MGSADLSLVVIPSDPVSSYERAGYDWLEDYYNPQKMFATVVALSPLERGVREAYGMTIRGAAPRRFAAALRQAAPRVVRAYGGYWPADLACRCRIRGVPVLVSVHDTNPTLLHSSVRYADKVICMSAVVRDQVLDKGVEAARVCILPNRVDTSRFRPQADAAQTAVLNSRFGTGRHILHIGRKSRQKNLDTVIRALHLLPADYSCVFVGQGDCTSYMELAGRMGVGDRCFWVESVKNSELPAWYCWCDCMCTPSRWEGFGIVFVEAAACGTPIVTSDIAPMNEYLVGDTSACLVRDYEDPASLAASIRRTCEDREYRARLSRGASAAAGRFEKATVEKAEAELYRDIIAAPARVLTCAEWASMHAGIIARTLRDKTRGLVGKTGTG